MDTTTLALAYEKLLAAAESVTDDSPLPDADRAQVDWVLAHVALSDRALAGAARQVLAGEPARIDNAPAMSKTAIASLLASTTHEERTEMVRRNAMELLGLLERTPDAGVGAAVQARLVDRGGNEVFDDVLMWGDVIRMRAEEHIPGHAANLASRVRNTGRT
ncbi:MULTISPECIES: hypothetical protein [Streptomyces]|uniref:DinB superfamily protein n=1 Tax=Streptomyces pini TaxID=1520580 RepID=A0A1I3ZKU1_9ACTN|nr:hypothetical protein [Streptomyces pini]SFK44655.1 hypothetical protein SAMN05192584_10667 [Streptomyces pini]